MKIWSRRAWLNVSLFLIASIAYCDEWKWQDGVIVQKLGQQFTFVFPSNKGRITAVARPSGKIQIGKTITLLYALKVAPGANARFVSFGGPKVTRSIKPELNVENNGSTFGFLIRDTGQDKLDIHIDPGFMKNIGEQAQDRMNEVQQRIANGGNLNVVVDSSDKVNFKIVRVEISK